MISTTPERFLSWRQVRPLVGNVGYTTWWRMMRAGKAPQPYKMTEHRVAWRESDIVAWQVRRIGDQARA
jgi:predicted DNA-binding transcriptional regulator AlpA